MEEEVNDQPDLDKIGTTYPFTNAVLPDCPDLNLLDHNEKELVHKHRHLVLEYGKMRDDPAWELKTLPTDKNNNLSVYFKPAETNESSFVCGEAEA